MLAVTFLYLQRLFINLHRHFLCLQCPLRAIVVQCPEVAKIFESLRSCVLSAIRFYTSLFHSVVPGSEFRIYD